MPSDPQTAAERLDDAYDNAMAYGAAELPNGDLLAEIVGRDQVERLITRSLAAVYEQSPGLDRHETTICALGAALTAGVALGYELGKGDAAPPAPTADVWDFTA